MWHVWIPQCLGLLLTASGLAWAMQSYFPIYYVNMSLRTDLSDIVKYYQGEGTQKPQNTANFWVCEVVELGKDEPWIVGCVGLDLNSQTFPGSPEVRRMSVESSYRHLGVARMLMETLEKRGLEVHASKLWLEISVHQVSAIRAYTRMGWVIVRTLQYNWDLQVVRMCRVLQSSPSP
ncbi:acyl-CoA N-acyltransferase [Piptocephalis cylindrospora]|uniref:Acyl-CoA N-acyltransferase n=1 Tax=Piptocephalis cylindrospora TaxID=1907219 RepID=A0A4P9Y717_9FUNG|nr:acyl-CoA N-acyltransferase [Piptocephalis cylindrospora]|eukprot:RKP14908.1 acyl-CoA N-acyltransferase [Piptocephalis cylindrospora]